MKNKDKSTYQPSPIDLVQAFHDLISDLGYDWPELHVEDKTEIAERLSKVVGQEPAWGWRYVQNVYQGMAPSRKFGQAILALGAAADGVPEDLVHSRPVVVQVTGNVRPGSLLRWDSKPCANPHCGISFIGPKNQKYHSPDCGETWRREQRKRGGKT